MWSPFERRRVVQNITVVVEQIEVDEAVEKIEAAIKKLETREVSLKTTIKEAKDAGRQLEDVIAGARRRARGAGGRTW
jgi:prefoldin subunit 5